MDETQPTRTYTELAEYHMGDAPSTQWALIYATLAQAEALTRLADITDERVRFTKERVTGQLSFREQLSRDLDIASRIGKAIAGEFLAHMEQYEKLKEEEVVTARVPKGWGLS